MKRFMLFLSVMISLVCCVRAGDAVEPASVTVTNARGEAVSAISSEVYYRDSTLLFTNCACLTAAGATQGLDSVAVTLTIGNSTTNIDYTGYVHGTSNMWWTTTTVPTAIVGTVNVQLQIVDENANTFIYPWKTMSHKASL